MNYASVLFSEIFQEFDKVKNREQRIAVLQKYGQNPWFREFLNYAFNPRIIFDIIKIPTYKAAVEPAGLCFSTLSNEMRRLYIFILGHPKRTAKLDAKKEERILSVLLGSIHKDEAALLVKCFKKDLGVKYLTPSLVKEAFPKMPFVLEVEPAVVKDAFGHITKEVIEGSLHVKKIKTTGATIKV